MTNMTDNIKKKGFTLFEALIAAGILSTSAVVAIKLDAENNKKENNIILINEAASIIQAVDSRILMDGYNPLLWKKTSWINEKDIVDNLIKKELTTVDSDCPDGDWVPSVFSEKETKIIKCGLWNTRRGLDLDMNANLRTDTSGFIQGFDLLISFNEMEDFKDNFMDVKYALINSLKNENKQRAGSHEFNFVDSRNTTNIIESKECISDPLNCSIKLSYNRSGGNEYIRADGKNSMINEHLSFIESKGDSPFSCIRWANTNRDGSGTWTQENVDCGIGIYNSLSSPVMVETVADTGTFKNVVLDQKCKIYEWNGSSVVDSGRTSPCGMTNDGSEVYQTVENIISNKGTFSNIESETAYINTAEIDDLTVRVANIDEIITPLINAEVINISNKLEVSGITNFKEMVTFNGDVNFNKEATFNSTTIFTQQPNFNGGIAVNGLAEFKKDLIVGNNASIDGDLSILGVTTTNQNLTIKENSTIEGVLNVGSEAYFGKNVSVANKITTGNVQTTNVTSNHLDANAVASRTANASKSMTAPIGNFDNINNQLRTLSNEIARINSRVNSGSTSGYDYSAASRECNARANLYSGTISKNCNAGYSGSKKYEIYLDFYWNNSSKMCTYSTKEVYKGGVCRRDNRGRDR